MVDISVVICTHNRSIYLPKALQSLSQQSLSYKQFEILVVDNGSTDSTKNIIFQNFSFLPNLRYLYEPRLGLNIARNTGWKNSCGKYVAYLDDDGVASPSWLEKILEGFKNSNVGCIGGKVNPIWESPRPEWLSDKLVPYLAILDRGFETIVSSKAPLLIGVNMAIPKKLLLDLDGFHPALDRQGDKLLSGGDIFLQYQIIQKGFSCLYCPEIEIWHHIQASRLTKRWFRQRMFWEGITRGLIFSLNKPKPRDKISRIKRECLALCEGFVTRILINRSEKNASYNFTQECRIILKWGTVLGIFHIIPS